MRTHHKISFNTSNQLDSNAKYFAQIALIGVFHNAFKETDARNQRFAINEGLRLATIHEVDGLDILRQALNEKYEANKTIVTAPLKVVATDGFQCPKCSKPFKSANALNAHRPSKCNG